MAEVKRSEKLVQTHVVNLLKSVTPRVYVLGTRRRKGDFPGTMQTKGLPDLYAILPPPPIAKDVPHHFVFGCGLWVECKAEGGRLRPEQKEFAEACGFAHIPHVVGGVDQVIAFLVAGGWLKRDNVAHYRLSKGAP